MRGDFCSELCQGKKGQSYKSFVQMQTYGIVKYNSQRTNQKKKIDIYSHINHKGKRKFHVAEFSNFAFSGVNYTLVTHSVSYLPVGNLLPFSISPINNSSGVDDWIDQFLDGPAGWGQWHQAMMRLRLWGSTTQGQIERTSWWDDSGHRC
jgi:hypothetical protein